MIPSLTSLTHFLTLFLFSASSPVPKKDTAKAKGRRVGGWGNPLVRLHQCMCLSVYVAAAEVAQLNQRDCRQPPWGEYESE